MFIIADALAMGAVVVVVVESPQAFEDDHQKR